MNIHLKIRIIVVLNLVLAAGSCRAAGEKMLDATKDYISEQRQQEGVEQFGGLLADKLQVSIRPGRSQLVSFGVAADCIRLMNLTQTAPLKKETLEWILASDERLHVLVDILVPQDNLAECFKIIDLLAAHDPSGRDKYFELIFALAVVWDVPSRPALHGQMGPETLGYSPELEKRYDYFKGLYESGASKMDYDKLSVHELIFVVDTPVPLEELQWVRRNVDGSLGNWGRKFPEIEYDMRRIQKEQYQWPHGLYTLASIQSLGGICVDQAYYCVLTARAYGIPAIYFRAIGKSGGHAWFSYMRNIRKWELDIGRYENQSYTTGLAVDPQTNEPMTDHDVEFACERSSKSAEQRTAGLYMALAEVLREADPETAVNCAHEARRLSKRYLPAWNLEMDLMLTEGDCDDLLKLFDEQKDVFRKYPDILAESARKIGEVLIASGRNEEASDLLKNLAGIVKSDRQDIAMTIELTRVKQIRAGGDTETALREFEQLLDNEIEQGSKVLPLIAEYLKFTKETGMAWRAAQFLEEYIAEVIQKGDISEAYERSFDRLLMQAYENAGNKEDADRIRSRIGME